MYFLLFRIIDQFYIFFSPDKCFFRFGRIRYVRISSVGVGVQKLTEKSQLEIDIPSEIGKCNYLLHTA